MTDLAVAGPLGELDFADEFRAHPVGVAAERTRRPRIEGARRLLERVEAAPQVDGGLVAKAGADLAGEHEAWAVVVADEQRADPDAAALRIGEPADDELLALRAFRLHPAAMAARLVRTIAQLRDNPFEADVARLLEERSAAALDMFGIADASGLAAADQWLPPRLARVARVRRDPLAVQSQQIEHEVHERPARSLSGRGVLQRLKAGTAVGENHRDLAVEQR